MNILKLDVWIHDPLDQSGWTIVAMDLFADQAIMEMHRRSFLGHRVMALSVECRQQEWAIEIGVADMLDANCAPA